MIAAVRRLFRKRPKHPDADRAVFQTYMDTISLDHATSDVKNAVYRAVCPILEELEHRTKIHGNGHHMAQEVSRFAGDMLRRRWSYKQS